ncbi:copper amine oxidase N-terminal domain-containing protein [Marinicrinis lubricantis]|uniref:Copper amine oxidase N-terminal domain-containing protein n=1 Tax=Marinicrinis lubricantis TaxID=2086470 RepID=A0ABW1IVI6_9BACL
MGLKVKSRWVKKSLLWISGVLSAAIVLTGCEQIAGVDIEKWMVQNSALGSYEAKGSISLRLETSESASLNDEQREVVDLFNGMELRFNHIAMENPYEISMNGEWVSGSLSMPITMSADQDGMALNLDGISKPIYISTSLPDEIPAEIGAIQQQFQSEYAELMRLVSAFAFKHLPNPPEIKLSHVTEKIQGQDVNLTHVHAVVKGSDLLPILTAFIHKVAEDEAGLKQLISELYDVLSPVIEGMMTMNDPGAVNSMPDKSVLVEMLYTAIQAELPALLEQWDSWMKQADQDETLQTLLQDDSYVSVDLYFDTHGYVRKQLFDITLAPKLEAEFSSIQSIQITGEMEYWNVDKPVEASKLDVSDALRFEGPLQPSAADFFRNVDPDSVLYELASMFDLNRTELFLMPFSAKDKEMAAEWDEPFVEFGITYVPVRYVAEHLGADVSWDRVNQQVTIIDSLTNKEIILKINSNHAWIDGNMTALPADTGLHLVGNKIYVPIKWLVHELGGQVEWQQQADIVIVERVY